MSNEQKIEVLEVRVEQLTKRLEKLIEVFLEHIHSGTYEPL